MHVRPLSVTNERKLSLVGMHMHSVETRQAAASERLQAKLLPRIRRMREVRDQREVVKTFGTGIANLK